MSVNRLAFPVLALLVAVSAACGTSAGDRVGSSLAHDPVATSTFATATTTSSTSTSTTGAPIPPPTATTIPAAPSYLVYGWEGVTRVQGGYSEQLITEPVQWAEDDGRGGIVFRSLAEEPGWGWLPAEADRPSRIDLGEAGWPRLRAVFGLDGRPSALVSRSFEGMSRCQPDDYIEELTILDVSTGDERFLMCHDAGADGGESISSFGGELLATVGWLAVGAGGTSSTLGFYDLSGERVTMAHNPFAESCAPCRLSAQLSQDGALLAYAFWPTAFWPPPQPPDGDYTRAYREWYAKQQDLPTEIVVMQMATGTEIFRTEVAADAWLTGFDGRFVIVSTQGGRIALDVSTSEVFDLPPATTDPAPFWTGIVASLDHDSTSYDEAQLVAARHADELGIATGVLWSDGFVTLNPGYWAVFTGHFDEEGEAARACLQAEIACYPRYVATADTIDPELGRGMLILGADGLGLVDFATPEPEVLALLERLVGSAPPDTWQQGPALDYIGWSELGLYLGFTRSGYENFDYPRFVGWLCNGASVELPLHTVSGVGIGTTAAELREIFGDGLVIPTEPDEIGELAVQLLGPDRGIWASLDVVGDVTAVAGLTAGVQPGV